MRRERLRYYVITNDHGKTKVFMLNSKPELRLWFEQNKFVEFKLIKGYEIIPKKVEVVQI